MLKQQYKNADSDVPGDGLVYYNHSHFSQCGQSCCRSWPPWAAIAWEQRRGKTSLLMPALAPGCSHGGFLLGWEVAPVLELFLPPSFCPAHGDAPPFLRWGSAAWLWDQQAGGGYMEPLRRRREPQAPSPPLRFPSSDMQISVCSLVMQIRAENHLQIDLQVSEPFTHLLSSSLVLVPSWLQLRPRSLVFVSDGKTHWNNLTQGQMFSKRKTCWSGLLGSNSHQKLHRNHHLPPPPLQHLLVSNKICLNSIIKHTGHPQVGARFFMVHL